MTPGPNETLDDLFRGELRFLQHRDGYRFSLDPIFLAAFVGSFSGRGIDFGTGCGILTLLLARRGASMVGVERQPALAALAERNVALNGLGANAQILQADFRALRDLFPPHSFDRVVSNPPYVAAGEGNLNPSDEKAAARHELNGSLAELMAEAVRLLRSGGRLALVLPAGRLGEVMTLAAAHRAPICRLRLVHSFADSPAKLALIEAVKEGRAPLEIAPSLIVHAPGGGFTPEVERLVTEVDATF